MSAASVTQRRSWFVHRHGDDPAQGNFAAGLDLSGTLDVSALEAALADLTARYPALRTRFPAGPDGLPVPTTLPAGRRIALPVQPTGTTDVGPAVADDARRSFDLTAEAPLRARLFRHGPYRHHLVLTSHDIAYSPRYMPRLIADLGLAYSARRRGTPPHWPRPAIDDGPPPLPADPAGSAFWERELAGPQHAMPLPATRPRTPRTSHAAHTLARTVQAAPLAALARALDAPLDAVLHAAVAVLLHQTDSGDDLTLATVKPRATTTGSPDDLLPLRLDVAGNPSFARLVQQVTTRLRGAHRHDTPFARLLSLTSGHDAATPLLQVVSETAPDPASLPVRLPGLTTDVYLSEPHSTPHDLHFTLRMPAHERHGEATATLTYTRDRFAAETAEALLAGLTTVLRAAAADPGRRTGRFPLLPTTGQPPAPAPPPRPLPAATVPELLARQARLTPDAVAVTDSARTLTYRELDTAATALARRLRRAGARPERVVALAVSRTADLVVATLAILKSGAAYLPLDARYPAGRLELMLRDAAPCLVLTDRGTGPLLPDHGLPELFVDAPPPGPDDHQDPAPPHGDNVAYVMYTSGSTGVPKGVAITHRGVVNGVTQLTPLVGMRPGAVMLACTSMNFDVSVFEIVTALATGARVDIVRDVLSVVERGGWRGDVLHTVPSAFREILDQVSGHLHVRTVICAGERLPAELVTRVRAELPAVTLINAYGQTESFYATAHTLPAEPPADGPVPIGTPLGNMRAYVLGPGLVPVPPTVAGELYVGGEVGRGYHARPALTAERFVADPFAGPGRRMYRTGDLARWNTRGELELIGRADAQAKVRGMRVEPAEIEGVLTTHPDIAQAAVTIRTDERGGPGTVIAHLVPATPRTDAQGPATRALRRYVADRLPAFMIPRVFVTLDRLPLTPNGKLDRSRLTDPGQRPPEPRAPRPGTEQAVAAAFAEILGTPDIAADDDFFACGGDSTAAVRLLARLPAGRGPRPTMRALLANPTVAGVALLLTDSADAL
ncbi:non-ribosomal peptide synthetase [Streptomyces sp. 130]|uniref:non-ribosomal peptide synthetase n=1 Tax=Streptomyces sp. 130 TaxID=2591006 RepID=UPI00163D84AE|nr:non-ribosomal peptide synthetase [Streptomyces sp. 130]